MTFYIFDVDGLVELGPQAKYKDAKNRVFEYAQVVIRSYLTEIDFLSFGCQLSYIASCKLISTLETNALTGWTTAPTEVLIADPIGNIIQVPHHFKGVSIYGTAFVDDFAVYRNELMVSAKAAELILLFNLNKGRMIELSKYDFSWEAKLRQSIEDMEELRRKFRRY
jgi:hypothetical protein